MILVGLFVVGLVTGYAAGWVGGHAQDWWHDRKIKKQADKMRRRGQS